MRFRGAWWLIASALVVAGCGGSNTSTTTQTALAVISVTPATGSTGVAVTAPVTATFNEVMNVTTFNSSTFTLTAAGGTAVTGNVSYSGGTSTAVFTPASPLAYNTVYTATITTGVQNPAGTALGANDTWSFTTATGPAPTVTAVTPGNGSTGLAAGTTVTATFSEAMSASTITASTFTLTPQGGAAVSATVSYNATTFTATLTPKAPLAAGTTYTAAVTTGVVGATGSAIANVTSWSFTTAEGPVPTVTAVTPASGTTGVAIASTVTATFSEAMDPLTVTGSTFTLTGGGASVTGTVTADPTGTIFTFTPSAPLAYSTTYTALITTGVQAASQVPEVPLAADYTWSFATAPPPPATVSAVTPASGSTGVAITGTTVTATFGAAMTASTINPSTFTLTGPSGVVAGAVTYNSTTFTATLTPSVSLANGATYTATIGTGATSSLGGPLPALYTWSFTTVKVAVPTVTSVTPTSGATNVIAANAVTATFSEPMNAATLTTSTFTLTATGLPAATGTVTYNTGTQTATFTPSAALAPSTAYTATITTGAQGPAGAALASNYTWTFTTGVSTSAVAVSFGTTYQTIRGFGASEVFFGVLPSAQITALYGQSGEQVGLSIMRVQIAPTTWTSSTRTANTGAWTAELTNAKAAQALGATIFASPWSPPASMKTNNSTNEGSLSTSSYTDYGNYLAAYATYAKSMGVNLYAISMQNEPDWNPCDPSGTDEGPNGKDCYVSCLWTAAQMDAWVAGYGTLVTQGANPVKLMMPESLNSNQAMSDPTLDDPAAVGTVSIIGGHLYGSVPAYYANAVNKGKDVWMTEHFLTPVSNGPTTSIADAIAAAEEIHNSMTVGQYNAYVWWEGPNTSVPTEQEHLVDVYNNPTYFGLAIAQFSRFVQPGYVRASATASPVTGVFVSAYTGEDQSGNQHYAIVAINANTAAQNINFTLSDAPTEISSMTPNETTSAGGLMPQTAVTVTGGQFYYTVPAQSIVTFVQ
jgi:O-glycosyl hydrolase